MIEKIEKITFKFEMENIDWVKNFELFCFHKLRNSHCIYLVLQTSKFLLEYQVSQSVEEQERARNLALLEK